LSTDLPRRTPAPIEGDGGVSRLHLILVCRLELSGACPYTVKG
jgi:hypothetical protein